MDENKNLVRFKSEFIAAGVRTHLKSFYNKLVAMGANTPNRERDLLFLSSNNPFVVLCTNEGVLQSYSSIKILNWNWWNYYHNRRANPIYTKKIIRTINLPRQWDKVDDLLVTENIPTLIAE